MGNTEQEQAEAMKRYIREVFIAEYAKNFNKGLSETDIKFYGKIHFDRSRSDNELNMHCHLIVSRKDQANKKKLSPLTNHKNTKNGTVVGGFDRVNLFQQAEQGFDNLFGHNRKVSETFEYCNIMKNGSITDKLQMKEGGLKELKQSFADEKINTIAINKHENIKTQINRDGQTLLDISIQQQINTSVNQPIHQQASESGLFTLFSMPSSATDINPTDEQQPPKLEKKKKRRPRLS